MIYQVIIACMDGYHSLVKCLFYAHVSPDSDDVWNRKAGLQLNELFDFYSAFVFLSIIAFTFTSFINFRCWPVNEQLTQNKESIFCIFRAVILPTFSSLSIELQYLAK